VAIREDTVIGLMPGKVHLMSKHSGHTALTKVTGMMS